MCALRQSFRELSPETRIRALAIDLVDDLAHVDLDTIDGEFYWRACRLDLLQQVEALYTSCIKERGATEAMAVVGGQPEQTIDHLRFQLRRATALVRTEARIAQLYPRAVWRRLLEGERIAMRAAEAGVELDASGRGQALSIRVFSGAWTGADVEEEVRRQDPERTLWLDYRDDAPSPHTVRLALDFALSPASTRATNDHGNADDPPFIEVTIPLPVPPRGVIQREYEALVRGQAGWHQALPGGGSRQDKEVAIRTWSVGLLTFHGMRFVDASRIIAEETHLGEVSQARFGQDRRNLLSRVTEARPFLYSRTVDQEPASDPAVPPAHVLSPPEHASELPSG